MNNKTVIACTAALLLYFILLSLPLAAEGVASFMGGLQAVGSDGPFDITRNPALMAEPYNRSAVGLSGHMRARTEYDSSLDAQIYIPGVSIFDKSVVIDSMNTKSFEGTGAFLVRHDHCAFGFALADHYQKETSAISMRFNLRYPVNGTMTDGLMKTKMDSVNTSNKMFGTIAFGYEAEDNVTIGVKIHGGSEQGKNKESNETISPGGVERKDNSRELDRSLVNLSLGMVFSTDDYTLHKTQWGIFFNSGTVSREKISFINRNSDSGDSGNQLKNFSIGKSTGNHTQYTDGASVLTGIYSRMGDSLALGFEIGIQAPNAYTADSLTTYGNKYYDNPSHIKNKWGYIAKGGIELNPARTVAIGTGLGLVRFTSESSSRSNFSVAEYDYQETRSKMLYLSYTLGANFQMTKKWSLIGYSQINMLKMESTSNNRQERAGGANNMGLSMTMKQTVFTAGFAVIWRL